MTFKTEAKPKMVTLENDGYCIDCSEQVSESNEKQNAVSDDVKKGSLEETIKNFLDEFLNNYSFFKGINTGKIYVTWEKYKNVWQTNIVDSDDFKAELRELLEYYIDSNKIYSDNKLKAIVGFLLDKVRLSKKEKWVYTRVAYRDESIYYNLNDSKSQTVKISDNGCTVVSAKHFFDEYFVMYSTTSMGAQKKPDEENDGRSLMDLLKPYINLKESEQILLVVTIITWFIADIPKPVIVLLGGQGTGKTTLSRMIKMIVDPSDCDAYTMPKSKEDLNVALANNYLLAIDNVSVLPKDTSDLLCSAVTGASSITRTLFTNNEVSIVTFQNALLINGITISNFKPDFYDRSILFEMERLQGEYKLTQEFIDNFKSDLPRILGEIFNTLEKAIKLHKNLPVSGNYRMADYAHWGRAISKVLFDNENVFLNAYNENRQAVSQYVLDENPVASVLESKLKTFFDNKIEGFSCSKLTYGKIYEDTPTNLLRELENETQKPNLTYALRSPNWPKTPQELSLQLKRLKEDFVDLGYLIDIGNKKNGKRYITITKVKS